jgi:hypothetical protein
MKLGHTERNPNDLRAMSDRVRDILVAAVQAGCHGFRPKPEIVEAIASGSKELTIEQLQFDSLAWMEFCIAVELSTGQELTPEDLQPMRRFSQIEQWLRARL